MSRPFSHSPLLLPQHCSTSPLAAPVAHAPGHRCLALPFWCCIGLVRSITLYLQPLVRLDGLEHFFLFLLLQSCRGRRPRLGICLADTT